MNQQHSFVIEAFARKLESLDTEIGSLTELRRLVDEFLQKRSRAHPKNLTIPLLYEETKKRLAPVVTTGPSPSLSCPASAARRCVWATRGSSGCRQPY
jgi:hypothetical protein